jgi:hypothetical protein
MVWVAAVGLSVGALVNACSSEPDEPNVPAGMSLIKSADQSAIEAVARIGDNGSVAQPKPDTEGATDPASAAVDKAGCTHILFCNGPGADEVVCDTTDRACSPSARFNECLSDADFVCGNWRHMRFAPPIVF